MKTIKKVYAILFFFLLVNVGLSPVVSASMKPVMLNEVVNNDFVEDDAHPAYYNVTRYHFKGFRCEEETIQVSYEDAMRMKKEYEHIDSLSMSASEKREKKHDVLVENELLSNDRTNLFANQMNNRMRKSDSDDEKEAYIFISTIITGTLGPCFINLLSLPGIAPFFLSYAIGVNVTLKLMFGLMGTVVFQSDGWVNIFVLALVGYVCVIPFFSPCGYIDAFAFLGGMNEM